MQNWGGGEEFLLNLCQNIKEYNFFIASPEGKAFQIFKENNFQTIKINNLKKIYRDSQKWSTLSKIKMIFNIIISTFVLIKNIKSKKINLIIANGNFAGLYSLPSKILTKKRFIVVQHLIYKKNSIEEKIINILNKYSDKFVCVSEAVAKNIESYLKDKSTDKLIIIKNGIQIPDNIETKHSNLIKIGMVGSIIRIKGIDLVLEALKDILIQKSNVKFYVYGDVTLEPDSVNYKLNLKKFIEESSLDNQVKFCGHVNSKDEIYNNLDLVINFSTIPEAFPVSILEAMSYKKIVIANDEGGPKEIINNSINGFLINKGNQSHLKEIINYCIENLNSEEFDKIRNNARRNIIENYSLEIFSKKYKELFDQLTSGIS